MPKTLERGDIYFFYRPKVDVEDVESLDQTQRFHIVMVPDDTKKGRLFVVGKKRLPEMTKGKAKSTSREWMMNYTTATPGKIGSALGPVVYRTKTKGERTQPEAIPAAEGRYALYERDGSTRLGYRVTNPKQRGKALDELGILQEASYVIAVRNPEVKVRGFPDRKPKYPKTLQKQFADERWIDVGDPKLLDYENAQLVLIGAHEGFDKEDPKITGRPNLFKKLGLERREWRTESIEKGEFAAPSAEAKPVAPKRDRTKGGKRGGRVATRAPSAAGLARALKGVHFPRSRRSLVSHAKNNEADKEVVGVLRELPNRQYKNMADVQKAFSEVR
ncbi:MAG: DUF2795 domain-containing protein [Myxococcota bacterium]